VHWAAPWFRLRGALGDAVAAAALGRAAGGIGEQNDETGSVSMNRLGRIAWIASSAVATLLLAVAAPWWPGRGGEAAAQYAQPAPAPAKSGKAAASAPGAGSDAAQPKQSAQPTKAMQPTKALQPELKPPIEPPPPPSFGGTGGSAGSVEVPLAGAKVKLPQIEGEYDIDELRRLIDLARESGFSDEQVREITVEDEAGHTVNAYAFLEAYDRRIKEDAARIAAEQNKIYLSPKDVMKELDKKQPQDLNQLRDKMLFVE